MNPAVQAILIYLFIQAIIGIVALEFAWSKTKRFREVNERRDGKYPYFRRTDSQYWARWKFYPGAILMMPTRLILITMCGTLMALFATIMTIGHDFKKGPMQRGIRKSLIYFGYHICCTTYLWVSGINTTLKYCDVDYSYYLGSNYKEIQSKPKRTSTIVSNHTSWFDPIVLIKLIRPAFAPTLGLKDVPLLNTLMDCLDSIYIPRGGSDEKRNEALNAIRER